MPRTLKTHRLATTAVAAFALVVGLVVAVPAAMAHTRNAHPAAAAHPATAYPPPAIKHVWIITLENESFGYSFGKPGEKHIDHAADIAAEHAPIRRVERPPAPGLFKRQLQIERQP